MIRNEKIADNKKKPLLLVCPLDWGLGHTTRMIPVISCLKELGCEVIVACNSTQKILLENEFTGLRFTDIDGYGIQYAHTRTATLKKLLLSIPRILIKIKREKVWFLRFFKQNRVDAVISDNRYGLCRKGIPSVFITHQLQVQTGFGGFADAFVRKFIYRKIKAFSECWVPDYAGENNLSGKLSHPDQLPEIPVHYLGGISRFEKCINNSSSKNILIILSGPEPQRTIFEKIVLSELRNEGHENIILVRGKPESDEIIPEIKGVAIYNHADAGKLNELICSSELIISRAGYTTIMDIIKLKRKLVVIPTPGQAEQEYLAKHLSRNHIVLAINQHTFSIAEAMIKSETFTYKIPDYDMNQYKIVIEKFIRALPVIP